MKEGGWLAAFQCHWVGVQVVQWTEGVLVADANETVPDEVQHSMGSVTAGNAADEDAWGAAREGEQQASAAAAPQRQARGRSMSAQAEWQW